MTIFDILTFITNLATSAMGALGALAALAGLGGLVWGCWDVIQHFKPENRDNPDQKSRLTSGIVKFCLGGLLATGGYQVIANNTFQGGIVTGAIAPASEQLMIVAADLDTLATQHGLTVVGV